MVVPHVHSKGNSSASSYADLSPANEPCCQRKQDHGQFRPKNQLPSLSCNGKLMHCAYDEQSPGQDVTLEELIMALVGQQTQVVRDMKGLEPLEILSQPISSVVVGENRANGYHHSQHIEHEGAWLSV